MRQRILPTDHWLQLQMHADSTTHAAALGPGSGQAQAVGPTSAPDAGADAPDDAPDDARGVIEGVPLLPLQQHQCCALDHWHVQPCRFQVWAEDWHPPPEGELLHKVYFQV
jgi:hypothetical protein